MAAVSEAVLSVFSGVSIGFTPFLRCPEYREDSGDFLCLPANGC